VAKVSADQIAKRLDSLLGQNNANGGPLPAMAKRRLAGTRAELTISQAQGVQAHAVDNSKVGLFKKLTLLLYLAIYNQKVQYSLFQYFASKSCKFSPNLLLKCLSFKLIIKVKDLLKQKIFSICKNIFHCSHFL
jgi:hypothetical protein